MTQFEQMLIHELNKINKNLNSIKQSLFNDGAVGGNLQSIHESLNKIENKSK